MSARTMIGIAGTALAATGVALGAPPSPSFDGIGVFGDGGSSGVYAVSGDGETAVGWATDEMGNLMAIKWTKPPNGDNGHDAIEESIGVGLCGIGRLPGTYGANDPSSEAFGVSQDGSTIVGMSTSNNGIEAFVWNPLEGIWGLGDLPSDGNGGVPSESDPYSSAAFGVSDDGQSVVGAGKTAFCNVEGEAFVWTPQNGMVGLGMLPAGRLTSHALGISGDGSVIVGWGKTDEGTQAGKWVIGKGFVELGDLPGGEFSSRAYAVSRDGLTIVGVGAGTYDQQPVVWDADGTIHDLGVAPAGSMQGEALAVSGDGSVIVGVAYTSMGDRAFVWDEVHGVRDLYDVMAVGYGVDVAGWELMRATGVSADGMIVVGEGISPAGHQEGWVASIRCPADMNGDFIADATDFVDFHRLASAGSLDADCDGNGVVNITDYVCFVKYFMAGCP